LTLVVINNGVTKTKYIQVLFIWSSIIWLFHDCKFLFSLSNPKLWEPETQDNDCTFIELFISHAFRNTRTTSLDIERVIDETRSQLMYVEICNHTNVRG